MALSDDDAAAVAYLRKAADAIENEDCSISVAIIMIRDDVINLGAVVRDRPAGELFFWLEKLKQRFSQEVELRSNPLLVGFASQQ